MTVQVPPTSSIHVGVGRRKREEFGWRQTAHFMHSRNPILGQLAKQKKKKKKKKKKGRWENRGHVV